MTRAAWQSGAATMRLVFDAWAAARSELESERDRHPGFADVRNLLGLLYLERGEPEAALAEFDAAIAVNPDYLLAGFHRLAARRALDGRLDVADWNEARLIERAPLPVRSAWTAWYLAQAGDGSGMAQACAHLAADPQFQAQAAYIEASFHDCLEQPKLAKQAVERAAAKHALYRQILTERGLVGQRALAPGSVASAATPLGSPAPTRDDPGAAAAGWIPSAWSLYEHLGTLCARHGAFEEAGALYDEAFLRQGDESRHLVRMARLALGRGDEEDAVRTLCRAIELDPTSVEARIALGFEYQSQGFPDQAVVQFEVAARLQPNYADLQANLGLLYEAEARDADAERCYRRALELNPNYFQARMSLAQLFLRSGAHREALSELEALIRGGLRSADLLVQKGEAHLALGEVNEAVTSLENAIQLNPNFPRTYYVLGGAYRKLGLKRKAQEAWRQHLDQIRRWQAGQPHREGEGRRS